MQRKVFDSIIPIYLITPEINSNPDNYPFYIEKHEFLGSAVYLSGGNYFITSYSNLEKYYDLKDDDNACLSLPTEDNYKQLLFPLLESAYYGFVILGAFGYDPNTNDNLLSKTGRIKKVTNQTKHKKLKISSFSRTNTDIVEEYIIKDVNLEKGFFKIKQNKKSCAGGIVLTEDNQLAGITVKIGNEVGILAANIIQQAVKVIECKYPARFT
jgi:hypothetical protein